MNLWGIHDVPVRMTKKGCINGTLARPCVRRFGCGGRSCCTTGFGELGVKVRSAARWGLGVRVWQKVLLHEAVQNLVVVPVLLLRLRPLTNAYFFLARGGD